MKVIFFGLGSIGQRHANILKKYKGLELYAYRSSKGNKSNFPRVTNVTSWPEIDRIDPDVAFITNPTHLHIETALDCARRGIDLFIEKPLGHNTNRLHELLRLVKKNKLTTYVAYCLRFSPVVEELKKIIGKKKILHMRASVCTYMPHWNPKRHYRSRYSSHKNKGGGIIFDLSHEIDTVHYLLGGIKHLTGNFGKRGNVTVDAEDSADLFIEANQGCANVHMNFFSHHQSRVIECDFNDRYIKADLLKNTLTEYKKYKRIKIRRLKGKFHDCYTKQIKYFLSNSRNKSMMNNIFDAADLFKMICAFKEKRNG